MEILWFILALVAAGWLLVGPFLVFTLFGRVQRLETELKRLVRERLLATPQVTRVPPAPSPVVVEEATDVIFDPEEEIAAEPQATVPLAEAYEVSAPGLPPELREPAYRTAPQVSLPETAAPQRRRPAVHSRETASLEELLAGRWMTWMGALAVMIGAGFAFKYAIDNAWLGPATRVGLGIAVGLAFVAGGAFGLVRQYRHLGQGLAGAGLGILYLALFAAFRWYELIPQGPAFVGMILVTVGGLALSTFFSAQPMAVLGLVGGLLTPAMLSRGVDARWVLFPYLLLLSVGVLGIAAFRRWQTLPVVAFVGVALHWIAWFSTYYEPTLLRETLILLTPFFVIFAALPVLHCVLRRQQAGSGDLFLVLANPAIYFAALYGLTLRDYANWQGGLAVLMAALYFAQGALLWRLRLPVEKLLVALLGVGVSFVTLSIPLQFSGHWIAIFWAAESVVLVELGLRFAQEKLRWAGFGLLGVVQLILLGYALSTFADPAHFRTDFGRASVDPVLGDLLPPASQPAVVTLPASTEPHWTDIFNGRSFSFLASAVALGILGWEYRRRLATSGRDSVALERLGVSESSPVWIIAGAPLTALGLLLVETYATGHARHWLFPTYVGAFSMFTAAIGVVLLVLSCDRFLESVRASAVAVFGLLGLLVLVALVSTLGNWSHEWRSIVDDPGILQSSWWPLVLLNPRGLGFVSAILGAGLGAWILAARSDEHQAQRSGLGIRELSLAASLGVFAYLVGFALVTSETFAQGVIRNWRSGTSLGITLAWTLFATATLVAGIYWRSMIVRILALGLFLLTTAKVFLFDVWQLSTVIRTFAFVGLGLALLLVSFLYRRFRDRIHAWISPNAAAEPD